MATTCAWLQPSSAVLSPYLLISGQYLALTGRTTVDVALFPANASSLGLLLCCLPIRRPLSIKCLLLLQLLGFSDLATGGMAVCASVGAAVGFLLGGGAGDYLSMRFPNTARPAVNQISQVLAGPLYVALLKGLPGEIQCFPHCVSVPFYSMRFCTACMARSPCHQELKLSFIALIFVAELSGPMCRIDAVVAVIV